MKLILICLLFLGLFGCNQTEFRMFRGEAQGTTYTIKYRGDQIEELITEIDELLLNIDKSMSTYLPSSKISQLNKGQGIQLDPLFLEVFELSKKMHALTDGAIDPSLGPVISAWGFDYAKAFEQMDSSIVDSLLALSGFHHFQVKGDSLFNLKKGASLNFNAIAQGYSVDQMALILEKYNIANYYIELGGELKLKGNSPSGEEWSIGIDLPKENLVERELSHILNLSDAGLATSGNYRQFYEREGKRYAHTIDPKTGFPVEHQLLSATVIAETSAKADAIATALMVMGLEKSKAFLQANPNYKGLLIHEDLNGDYQEYISPGLKEKLKEID